MKRGGKKRGRRVHSGLRGGGVVLMSGGELVHSTRSQLVVEFFYLNWFSYSLSSIWKINNNQASRILPPTRFKIHKFFGKIIY